MITTSGKNQALSLLFDGSRDSFDGIAVGTDSTTATVAQTSLVARVYGESSTTYDASTTKALFDMDMGIADYPPTGSVTLKEVGLFTSSDGSSGQMLCRQVISDTLKDTTIAYRFNIYVDVKNV